MAARTGGRRQPSAGPPGGALPRDRRGGGRACVALRRRLYPGVRGDVLVAAPPRRDVEPVPPRHGTGAARGQHRDLPLLLGADVHHLLLPGADRVRSARHAPGEPLVPGHGPRRTRAGDGGLPAPRGGGGVNRLRGLARRRVRPPRVHAEHRVPPGAPRIRLQGGLGPAPRVAAARASGGPEPRLRADVRRDGQARHLRAASDHPRSARRRTRLVGRHRPGGGGCVRAARRPVRPDGAGPQEAPGLLHRGERRHHLSRRRRGAPVPQLRASGARAPRAGGRPLSRPQPCLLQGPALPRRGGGAARDAHAQHGSAGRPHQGHAPDRPRLPAGGRRHLGPAAAQRLRFRVARLPGAPRRGRAAAARSSRSSCPWRWGCSP